MTAASHRWLDACLWFLFGAAFTGIGFWLSTPPVQPFIALLATACAMLWTGIGCRKLYLILKETKD